MDDGSPYHDPAGGSPARSTEETRLARARVLLAQGRFANAEEETRAALASAPDSADAHALLALALLGQARRAEAQRAAEAAIAARPDEAWLHHAHGVVLLDRHDLEGAARCAQETTRLDPADPDGHALLGEVRLRQGRWAAAQEAAERGLRLDPEHGRAVRVRAMALMQQGQGEQAGRALEAALTRAPDDDATHAALGWTRLDAGRHDAALEHFREALRLDPDNDHARAGMLEALKGRYRVYGLLLRYMTAMSKLTPGQQWAVIVGGYIGYRVLRDTAKKNPDLAPWIAPLLALYIAFVALTWIGGPLFNLLLRANRFGRHLLTPPQVRETNWLAGALALALGLLGASLATGSDLLLLCAMASGVLVLPLMGTFRCAEGWPRRAMAALTAGLALLAVLALARMRLATDLAQVRSAVTLWQAFFIGALLSQFAANALGSVTPRR